MSGKWECSCTEYHQGCHVGVGATMSATDRGKLHGSTSHNVFSVFIW